MEHIIPIGMTPDFYMDSLAAENEKLKANSVPFAVLCCNCVRLRYNSHEEKYCFDTADTPTKQNCPLAGKGNQ